MKTISLLVLLAVAGFTSAFAQSSQVILQPGPGLNDGTDDGSADAGKDTGTDGNTNTTNYGTVPVIFGTGVSNCNDAEGQAYIRFNLDSLPSAAQTDSAFFGVFHMPHTSYCYSNCDLDFYFYRLTQGWDEITLTYSNAPTYDTAAFYGPVNVTFPNDFGNREYDITGMYKDWKNGTYTNYGFTIFSPEVGCNNAAVMFYAHSSDDSASVRPYLRVVYGAVGVEERQSGADGLKATLDGKMLFLESDAPGARASYDLFGMTGVKAASVSRNNASGTAMDVSGLASGLYMIRARTDKSIATRKVYLPE